MSALTTSLHWHNLGISTIPIGFRSKRPDFKALAQVGSANSEGTGIWEPYKERLPTLQELVTWFDKQLRNIAIVTGHQDLVILDIDNIALYGVWQHWASPHVQRTYKVQTARGFHLYYYMDDPPTRGLKWPGIDVKAAGGYCLVDPSVHPSGHQYKAIEAKIARVGGLADILPEAYTRQAEVLCRMPQKRAKKQAVSPWEIRREMGLAESIKEDVRILEFLSYHRQTSSDGRWYVTHCPFHQDRHESFWIDDLNNRCGCHAGCIQGSADVIGFFAKLKGISCKEAITCLKK